MSKWDPIAGRLSSKLTPSEYAEVLWLELYVEHILERDRQRGTRPSIVNGLRELARDLETRRWDAAEDLLSAIGSVVWVLWLHLRFLVGLACGWRNHTVIEVSRIPRSQIYRIEVCTPGSRNEAVIGERAWEEGAK